MLLVARRCYGDRLDSRLTSSVAMGTENCLFIIVNVNKTRRGKEVGGRGISTSGSVCKQNGGLFTIVNVNKQGEVKRWEEETGRGGVEEAFTNVNKIRRGKEVGGRGNSVPHIVHHT